jgi:two-component sensor histidine kinase
LCKNVVDHAEDGTEATWSLTADAHTVRFRLQNQARTMHPASKRSHDTTRGIGMQIARRIVEEMHGNIDVQREGASIITTVSVPRKTKL